MIILSDLSEVLIHGIYGTQDILLEDYGPEVAGVFWQTHIRTERVFHNLMRGKMSDREYWKLIYPGHPKMARMVRKALSKNLHFEVPGTLGLYQEIQAHPERLESSARMVAGMPEIWVASDHVREWAPLAITFHPELGRLVENFHWSYDYGMLKSDPGFFRSFLEKTGLGPREVLFIDDMPINVVAAEDAGIPSIVFYDAKSLKTSLIERGFCFDLF